MKNAISYVWCSLVSWLMLKTFGVTIEDVLGLARARRENDRLRLAFVRAKQVIIEALEKKIRHDADTLPSLPIAGEVFGSKYEPGLEDLRKLAAKVEPAGGAIKVATPFVRRNAIPAVQIVRGDK